MLLKSFCSISEQYSLLFFYNIWKYVFKSTKFLRVKRSQFFFHARKRGLIKTGWVVICNFTCFVLTKCWYGFWIYHLSYQLNLQWHYCYLQCTYFHLFQDFLLHFSENYLFRLSATTFLLDSMSSFSFTSVILLTVFRFSENKGWIFFQSVLLSFILLEPGSSKKFFCSRLYNPLQ